MLGEVLLRRKARTSKATVPLLADGDVVVMGSFEIIQHADGVGEGTRLVPADRKDAVARWVAVAEEMMHVGRAWLTKRLLASKQAQAEALPGFVPGTVRGLLAPSTAMALHFLAKKYAIPDDVEPLVERTVRPRLLELREALARHRDGSGEPTYVLGPEAFTAADLVLASTLQLVRPHATAKLGPATREAWSNPALADGFGDLLAWRDAVYAKHR